MRHRRVLEFSDTPSTPRITVYIKKKTKRYHDTHDRCNHSNGYGYSYYALFSYIHYIH